MTNIAIYHYLNNSVCIVVSDESSLEKAIRTRFPWLTDAQVEDALADAEYIQFEEAADFYYA